MAADPPENAMRQLASTARAVPADAEVAPHDDERMDVPRTAMLVLSLSLAAWTGIAFAIRWLLA